MNAGRPGRCGSRSVQAANWGMRYALTCARTFRTCPGPRGNTPAAAAGHYYDRNVLLVDVFSMQPSMYSVP